MNYKFNESKHLHSLDGKPLTGCSTITDVLAKPLTWWASGKAVEVLGWTNSKTTDKETRTKMAEEMLSAIKLMSVPDYLYLLDKAYKAHNEHKKKAADKGIDLHAELESFVLSEINDTSFAIKEQIQPFVTWSNENVKQFLWTEAHSFDEDTFTGGISDAGAILNDSSLVVFDFKSAKSAYISHFIQAGGYCLQIRKNGLYDKNGKIQNKSMNPTHIAIVPFGCEPVIPVIKHCEPYENAFKYAVELYRIMGLDKED